jgi:hypothetical protein
MPADKIFFNQQVSRLRVLNEHCIGMLKARFQSPRELRVLIRGKEDVDGVCRWFNACCVLHNILLESGFYDREWDGEEEGADEEDGNLPDIQYAASSAIRSRRSDVWMIRRDRIKDFLLSQSE